MDTRLTTTHGIWQILIAAMVALALVMALWDSSASAASPTACRVQNTSTGRTYTALRAAVDVAIKGARLTVQGTCVGTTVIDKALTIVGTHTATSGKPRLSGADKVRVLAIEKGVPVKIRDLEILRGWAHRGAGVRNLGHLTLADVEVRGGATSRQMRGDGGGIYNVGRLVLNGRTRIADNYSGGAGGIANEGMLILNGSSMIRGGLSAYGVGGVGNFGTLTMNDASVIRHNSTWEDEGVEAGVYNGRKATATMNDASSISGHREGAVENDGKFTMNDSSSIHGNRYFGAVNNEGAFTMNDASSISDNTGGCYGAGVSNWGRLTMTGASSITGNTVVESYWGCEESLRGGGVYHASGKLIGVTCGPDGNVRGNSPDDCYVE